MKHRYIFCGVVCGTDEINKLRLISNLKYSGGSFIRVNIPENVILNHCNGDSYSTTECGSTLDELGYDCYILYEGHWRKFNWLKCLEPHEWYMALEYLFNLYDCFDDCGYTLNEEKYNNWYDERMFGDKEFIDEEARTYPRFKEDKKGLDLKIDLREYPFDTAPTNEKWWSIYVEEFEKKYGKKPVQCSATIQN